MQRWNFVGVEDALEGSGRVRQQEVFSCIEEVGDAQVAQQVQAVGLHRASHPQVAQQPRRPRRGRCILQHPQPLQHVLQPHLHAHVRMCICSPAGILVRLLTGQTTSSGSPCLWQGI